MFFHNFILAFVIYVSLLFPILMHLLQKFARMIKYKKKANQ